MRCSARLPSSAVWLDRHYQHRAPGPVLSKPDRNRNVEAPCVFVGRKPRSTAANVGAIIGLLQLVPAYVGSVGHPIPTCLTALTLLISFLEYDRRLATNPIGEMSGPQLREAPDNRPGTRLAGRCFPSVMHHRPLAPRPDSLARARRAPRAVCPVPRSTPPTLRRSRRIRTPAAPNGDHRTSPNIQSPAPPSPPQSNPLLHLYPRPGRAGDALWR
jgi:hypothetical protein